MPVTDAPGSIAGANTSSQTVDGIEGSLTTMLLLLGVVVCVALSRCWQSVTGRTPGSEAL